MSGSQNLETSAIESSRTVTSEQSIIILLVEDCLEDRETIKRYLLAERKDNYRIFEASTAEQGFALYQRCQPDIVLLDYRLPDSDGLELLEQIQQSESENHSPVILLTGQGNEQVAVQAMKTGVCDYLVKGSMTLLQLRTVVNCAIQNARLRAQLRQERSERDRQIEREKLIAQIANQIHLLIDIDEILDATASQVRQFLGCDRVFIYRFEPDWSGIIVAESAIDGLPSVLNVQVEDTYFQETRGEDYRLGRMQSVADIYNANLTDCHVELLARFRIRANLVVPIKQANSLWGLLVANQCSGPRHWNVRDIELLEQLTTHVGIAIAQAELVERERLVARMQEQIRQSLDIDKILQATVSQVRQFLRTDRVLVFRLEGNGNGIVIAESVSPNTTAILSTEIFDPCLVEGCLEPFQQGLAIAKTDVRDAGRDRCYVELLERFDVQANLVVPIKQGDRLWGLLIAHHCVAPRLWRLPEIELLKHLATQVGIALQQARLYERVQIELAQRQYTEEALRQSERRYRAVVEDQTELVCRFNPDCTLTFVNEAYCRFFDLSAAELIGRNFLTLIPEAERDRVRRHIEGLQDLTPQNPVATQEHQVYQINGRVGWLEWTNRAIFDKSGRIVELQAVGRDKTASKQTEELLRQSQATIRRQLSEIESIYNTAPIGLCFVDTELRFVRVNEQLAQINGLPVSAHIGRTLREIIPEMADDLEPLYRQVIESGEPILNLEVSGTNRAQPGVERYWIVSYYPQKNSSDRVLGVNVTVQEITDRKRSEEALRTSEEQIKIAQQCANAGLWNWDMLTNQILWSNDYYELYGLDRSLQPSYENWLASIVELDRARVHREVREAIDERKKIDIEYRILHPKRGLHWLNALGDILYGADGQPQRMTGITLDVTERKIAEQSLRESEELLQLGIQVAGFAIAKFDYVTNTVALSPEAAALYGLPPDEPIVTRSRLHETFHPEEREEMARIIEQVIDPSGSGWFARDHRVVHPNGEVRWLSVRKRIFFDRTGELARPQYAILAAIDITERKRVEEDLRESNAILNAINQATTTLIYAKDRQGRLLIANPATIALNGKPEEELLGHTDLEFFANREEAEQIMANDRLVMETGQVRVFEEQANTPSGTRIYLSTKSPYLDEAGNVIGLIGVSTEITDRKEAEQKLERQAEELRQLTERLADRNEELDRFTHTVSHDLKAPLRAIVNLSQWIAEDLEGQLSVDNQRQMTLLLKRVRRMENFIDGLLAYSRIGRTEVSTVTVDVGELLAEIIDSLAPPPTFTIVVQPQMPTIVAKRLLLSQVFSNLISNAIKHCDRADGRIEISATRKGRYYEFSVADNGRGIAPEHHDRIFGIFQTLKSRDAQENTGIGLSIVKKIVETEGGEVTLESELGSGSTFRFTWLIDEPLANPHSDKGKTPAI